MELNLQFESLSLKYVSKFANKYQRLLAYKSCGRSDNEELQDLLTTTGGEKKLKLMEDPKKGVVCQNLEEIAVLSVKDIFDILKRGVHQRTVSATMHNKTPSRSHTIFTMKIMITESNGDGDDLVRHGQLNLVDLAG
jgi:kinesin family protein 11